MINVIKYMIDFKLSIGISDLFSSACNNDGALLGICFFGGMIRAFHHHLN